MASTTIGPITSGATAATTTPTGGTLTVVDTLTISQIKQASFRLEVTTGITGSTPTLDIYLQRATQSSPTDDDWDDFYHFPQVTTSAVDYVVHAPLPLPQDVDGSLGSASHAVVQESLAADTLLAGALGEQIRIREKVGGTGLTAAVYSIHIVANG
tara:strand:- start:15940 stop:16407 length:468 start_codon:yes stop_codon:yes gene_type:complete